MLGYIYSQLLVVGIALCITAFGVLLPSLLAIPSLICLVEIQNWISARVKISGGLEVVRI